MTTQLLHPKVDPTIQALNTLTEWYYKKYPSDDFFVPHLEHWLAVLDKSCKENEVYYLSSAGQCWKIDVEAKYEKQFNENKPFEFNLTTGQPADEASYQAFNDIVSVYP